jgi:hypothetical protein
MLPASHDESSLFGKESRHVIKCGGKKMWKIKKFKKFCGLKSCESNYQLAFLSDLRRSYPLQTLQKLKKLNKESHQRHAGVVEIGLRSFF